MNTPSIRRSQHKPVLRRTSLRSRSPESRPPSIASATPAIRKKKKQRPSTVTTPTISSANNSRHNQLNIDQSLEDDLPVRIFKPKLRQAAASSRQNDSGLERGRHSSAINRKDKDHSMSGERSRPVKRTASPEAIDADDESSGGYTGPLALAEFNRLKVEVERLKEQLHHSKKTIHKQSKVIDELRQEVTSVSKSNKEHVSHVEKLKIKSKKSEELLGNIEGSLQCQICLDTLLKPFALSPCGHVLCQTCLQNWFRAAPANENDMYDDDPLALIYRRKTCPCCRTVIRTRPVPLFIVKSIASAFDKANSASSRRPSPPPDPDPWAGIFLDDDEVMSSDGEEDDDDDDDDDDFAWATYDDTHGYGSDSGNESYEGEYVPARWQPASVPIDPSDFDLNDLDANDFKMLRRGATLQMIQLFNMEYSHSDGLSILVDDINRIYLGWNISLHPEDCTGEEFVDYTVNDIFRRGERWELEENVDGSWVAWKLVLADEDGEFETTDSEAWEADDGEGESD